METFKRLSDTISVHNRNSSIFLVNGEWTFILPDGLYYELDSEFDGEISGGIDLSGSVKPILYAQVNAVRCFFGNTSTAVTPLSNCKAFIVLDEVAKLVETWQDAKIFSLFLIVLG